MTIYDLLLYIALAALPFWGLLGVGHAKLKKYETIHYLGWYWQYFVGCLLVFSGFVKAVDPLGTAYKMKDYFAEFKQQGLPLMETMIDFKVSFSVLMIIVEVIVGLFLILGIGNRKTLWINLLMMLFFTFLTGFNYLTGYTPKGVGIFEFSKWTAFNDNNIRITDCGCFGDFLKLKPLQTFVKDIFLSGISIYFMLNSFRIKEFLPSTPKVRNGIGWSLTIITTVFCLNNFVWNDAFMDFRPFAEGVNIKQAKEECAKNKPEVQMTYHYKNKSDNSIKAVPYEEYMKNFKEYADTSKWKPEGKLKYNNLTTGDQEIFEPNNLPKDIKDSTKWSFASVEHRKDVILKEGCNSKVKDFTQFAELDDYTQFPELEKSNGYAFLVTIPDLDKTDLTAIKKIGELCRDAEKTANVPTYCLYYNVADKNNNKSKDDEIEAFRQAHQLGFYFTFGDEKLVLTIIRADPGLILFHKGTIVKKWHHKQLPADFPTLKVQHFK